MIATEEIERERLFELIRSDNGIRLGEWENFVFQKLAAREGLRLSQLERSLRSPDSSFPLDGNALIRAISFVGDALAKYFSENSHGRESIYRIYIQHFASTNVFRLDIKPNEFYGHTISQEVQQSLSELSRRILPSAFLCHASDDKSAVIDIYNRLFDHNVRPWLDAADLIAGQNWEGEIRRAIKFSDVVIVFLSRSSLNKFGYVQKEIKSALDVADEKPADVIFVIPARLEDCQLPDRLSHLHCVDLYRPEGFNKLLRAIHHKQTASAS